CRARVSFLGLPLVHIRIGDRFDMLRKPVKAWIASGGYAIGGLFAFGGIAIARLSLGFCTIVVLPFGGIALGAFALGGLAVGIWSFGGLAVGWQACGCCAVAWHTAVGG